MKAPGGYGRFVALGKKARQVVAESGTMLITEHAGLFTVIWRRPGAAGDDAEMSRTEAQAFMNAFFYGEAL